MSTALLDSLGPDEALLRPSGTITAHKSGKVAFIGFEDGQPIEFDQLLIVIE